MWCRPVKAGLYRSPPKEALAEIDAPGEECVPPAVRRLPCWTSTDEIDGRDDHADHDNDPAQDDGCTLLATCRRARRLPRRHAMTAQRSRAPFRKRGRMRQLRY